MYGTLYLTGTPIGNMEDISARCLRVLAEVDMIAAEDTRQTQKILQFHHIKNKIGSYHEHNKKEKQEYYLGLLREGKSIALVTDAGMPGISDPGEELVAACIREAIPVTVVPSGTAFVTAAVLSGFPLKEILFLGFFPTEKKEFRKKLEEIRDLPYTVVCYEAPHRLLKTLIGMKEILGEERRIALARELTKKFEEIQYLTLAEAIKAVTEKQPRGEYVIVLEGKSRDILLEEEREAWSHLSFEEHCEIYVNQGLPEKEAWKRMAKERGISKREIYAYFHKK